MGIPLRVPVDCGECSLIDNGFRTYGMLQLVQDIGSNFFVIQTIIVAIDGGIIEETMALMIQGEQKQPVWHTWSGLGCKECNADIDEGVRLLTAFDHSWAGQIAKPRKITFLNAD